MGLLVNPAKEDNDKKEKEKGKEEKEEEKEEFFDAIDEEDLDSTIITANEQTCRNNEIVPSIPPLLPPRPPRIIVTNNGDSNTSTPIARSNSSINEIIDSLENVSLITQSRESLGSPLSRRATSSVSESTSQLSVYGEMGSEQTEPRQSFYKKEGNEPFIHPLAGLNDEGEGGEGEDGGDEKSSESESEGTLTGSTGMTINSMRSFMLSNLDTTGSFKPRDVKVKTKKKTRSEFSHLYLIQELQCTLPMQPESFQLSPNMTEAINTTNTTTTTNTTATTTAAKTITSDKSGPIYCLKFSPDGNFLASAGEDGLVRIWKLIVDDTMAMIAEDQNHSPLRMSAIFHQEAIQTLVGHEDAVLDLSWSKNNFLLSASMDKTVRLWHYSRNDCLGVFKHTDFVTSVAFHPRDDRIFITGSLDCRIRLWSIAEKGVRAWNELPTNNFVTSVAFNYSGRLVLAGTSTGVCLVFETEGFNYYTQIHVRSRRGKNRVGRKICSIEAMPGNAGEEKILISTNDSRIRLYTLRDKSLVSKFIGHHNSSSQMRATFSSDGEFIISGSEDCRVYIWSVEGRYTKRSFFSSKRATSYRVKAREWWETHSKPVTSAIFAPLTVRNRLQSIGLRPVSGEEAEGAIIVAADLNGKIKVYENNSLLERWLVATH